MKSNYKKAFLILFFVSLMFLLFTINRTSYNVAAPADLLENKESAKTLFQQQPPASVPPESASIDGKGPLPTLSDSASEQVALNEKADACALMRMDGEKLSNKKTIEKIFKISNKFRDDHANARTSEFLIKNILHSGPVDPDAPVDTNDIIEFYRALVYGGLISPKDYKKFIDYKKAEEILSALEVKHPENGAFSIFKAGVLHVAGTPDTELKPLLVKGMMASEFNTFHSEIWIPVLQRSFANSEVYVMTQRLMGYARIIDYTTALLPLSRLLESKDPEYAKLVLEFARKLYPKNIPAEGRFEFFEWFALDFAMSERLRFRALQSLDRNQKITPVKSLSEVSTWHNDPEAVPLKKNKDGSFDCDLTLVQHLISKEENLYLQFLKSKSESSLPSN